MLSAELDLLFLPVITLIIAPMRVIVGTERSKVVLRVLRTSAIGVVFGLFLYAPRFLTEVLHLNEWTSQCVAASDGFRSWVSSMLGGLGVFSLLVTWGISIGFVIQQTNTRQGWILELKEFLRWFSAGFGLLLLAFFANFI
jgi:uncharacterized membrane protein